MQASIVDLRYKMAEIKHAIQNNEIVTVTDRGHPIADIYPRQAHQCSRVEDHPYFGCVKAENNESVDSIMQELRGGRYNDDL